jgi:topoisomerase IA-like protein
MSYGTMSRKVLMSALALLALGSPLAIPPTRADAREVGKGSTSVQLAQVQTGRYGPYATARRANEVASYFRSFGCNAQVFPEWGAYYVNVW